MADSGASDLRSLITTKQPERSLNRQIVLEEDEYTEALSKIIARDFFPSLAHLEATNTFLSSLDSQDPEKIQESVRRLSDLRDTPQSRTPRARATPYGRTPYDTPLRTPRVGSPSDPVPSQPTVDLSLSLDAFQTKYTSEDNSSFTEIVDEENRQRRQRYAWAWDAERRATEKKAREIETRKHLLLEAVGERSDERLMVEGGTVTPIEAPKSSSDDATEPGDSVNKSDAGTLILSQSGEQASEPVDAMAPRKDKRPAAVPGWRFKTRNSLMFPPDADVSPYHPSSPPTTNKSGALAKEAGRVVHTSTRLPEQSEEVPSVPPSPTRSRIGAAISGTPYHHKVNDTPKVSGYGFVDALPSPSPSALGPDAMKELMTWGTLLATPRVIINEDDGVPASTSNARATNPFTITGPSSRDAIGRKLGSQAGRSLREKAALLSSGVVGVATPGGDRKRKSDMLPPAFTPRRSGVANADMLSPAARTLLGRTKSGGALGFSPRPPSAPAIPPHTLRNKGARGGKEVDLSKVGWSPSSTPVSRSRRDR